VGPDLKMRMLEDGSRRKMNKSSGKGRSKENRR
jgi:hypothetical protein